jgi:hypothetical protein
MRNPFMVILHLIYVFQTCPAFCYRLESSKAKLGLSDKGGARLTERLPQHYNISFVTNNAEGVS